MKYLIILLPLINVSVFGDDTCPKYYVQGDPGVYWVDRYEQEYERFTGDTTRILKQINQCELFPGVYTQEHNRGKNGSIRPQGLSLLWAQEYTGSDLLFKRINAHRPVLCPDSNLLEIWDSNGFHGNGVASHIMSAREGAIIPERKECEFKIPRDTAGYQKIIDNLKGKQEKCSVDLSKCPKYINASLALKKPYSMEGTSKSELKAFKDFTSRTPSVLVLAAGNDPVPTTNGANELGKEKRAIVVSSIDEDGAPSYTSYGEGLSVSAPSNEFTATPTGDHRHFGGTSGAAPQVTGTLAAFTLITGYPLSTKESATILEKTAIKYTSTPIPNMIGKGMLNSYQIGEIAFKLKEKCKEDKDCIKRSLEDESLYTGKGKDDKLAEISKYYPGYPSCSGETRPNEKISCSDRRRFVEELRKEAFMSKSSEHWKALSCISKLDGKAKNAQYYEKLATRYSFDDEEKFLEHLITSGDHAHGLNKYVFNHPKWRKHPKFAKWFEETIMNMKPDASNLDYVRQASRIPGARRDIVDRFMQKNKGFLANPESSRSSIDSFIELVRRKRKSISRDTLQQLTEKAKERPKVYFKLLEELKIKPSSDFLKDYVRKLFPSKSYPEIFDRLKTLVKTDPQFFKKYFLKLLRDFKPQSDEESYKYDEILNFLNTDPEVSKIIDIPKVVSDLLKDRDLHRSITSEFLSDPKWIDSPYSDKWMETITDNILSRSEKDNISKEIMRLKKQLKEESLVLISDERIREIKEKIKEKYRQIEKDTGITTVFRALESPKWQEKPSYQKNLIKVLDKYKVSSDVIDNYRFLFKKIKEPENVKEFTNTFMEEVKDYIKSSSRDIEKDKSKAKAQIRQKEYTIKRLELIGSSKQWKEDVTFQQQLQLAKAELEKVKERYK